ncbi:MAG: phosphotransferase family protein [Sciscionella sp.]
MGTATRTPSGNDWRARSRTARAALAWLLSRLEELQRQYEDLPTTEPERVIHGDAWQGNLVVPDSAPPTLLDLEHVSLGRTEWDLIPIAVDYADFVRLTPEDYRAFVSAYGDHDVTSTASFHTLADIQELRWVTFVFNKANTSDYAARETTSSRSSTSSPTGGEGAGDRT